MCSLINTDLARNAALITKGKAAGRLRQEMMQAGFRIGQGTLQRILAGNTGVRMASLQQFADYFGVDLVSLLRGRTEEDEDCSSAAPRGMGHAGPKRSFAVGQKVSRAFAVRCACAARSARP